MIRLRFSLTLSSEQYLAYYQGHAKGVSVVTDTEHRIEFPAEHLRPFLTHTGISGKFEITFDEQNRFIDLQRC